MKKITSITLCLLLVFSTAFCLLLSPTSASADDTTQTSNRISTNLVADGGFDAIAKFRAVSASRLNASEDEWFTKMQTGNGIPGSSIQTDANDNNNKYIILNRTLYQVVAVEPNQTYKIYFRLRAEGANANPAEENSLYIRLLKTSNENGTASDDGSIVGDKYGRQVFAANELSTTEWKTYSFTLTTGNLDSASMYAIQIDDRDKNGAGLYSNRLAIDDIVVVPASTNLVADGGFDAIAKFRAVSASRLNASEDEWFTKMQTGNGIPGSSIQTDANDNNNKYIILNRTLYQVVAVEPNQTYKIYFRLRAEGANANPAEENSLYIRLLKTSNENGTASDDGSIVGDKYGRQVFAANELSTTAWKTYSFTLTTGNLDSASMYAIQIDDRDKNGAGLYSNRLAIDDIAVIPLTVAPSEPSGPQEPVVPPELPPTPSISDADLVGKAFASSDSTVFSAEKAATIYGKVAKTTAWRHPDAKTEYAYISTAQNYAHYAAIPLTFEKNTYYTVTFYYWSEIVSTKRTWSNVRIMRDGGTLGNDLDNLGAATTSASTYVNQQGATINLSYKIEPAVACQWNKMTLAFYSGDNTSGWLALRHVVQDKDAYVDGLTLEKLTTPLPSSDAKPFAGWGQPQDESIINFDDHYIYFDQPDRFEVATAPARDGKTSKALHTIAGASFTSNGLLNKNEFSKNNTKRDKVFTIPVKPNTKYEFGFWAYIDEKEENAALNYFTVYVDYKNTDTGVTYAQSINLKTELTTPKEWVWLETQFITAIDQTFMTICANISTSAKNVWLDDFTLTAMNPGALSDASEASYCEEFYNILAEQDSYKDMAAAKSGVYPIAVEQLKYYTFGATASSNNANSPSRAFLSFDGVNPMPKGVKEAPEVMITAKSKGRVAFNMMNGITDTFYLVIENDDKALSLTDIQLFETESVTVFSPMGYAENPNGSLKKVAELSEIKVLGVEVEEEEKEQAEDMESPATGSRSILPVMLIFATVALLGAVLVFTKKGGAQYE